MLTIPLHTSHCLQPLDMSSGGPFKTYFNRAPYGWMRSNQGKTASIYQVPGCVSEALLSAMTPWNVSSGFRSAGIYLYNRDLFFDAEFEPSMVSDRPTLMLQSAAANDSLVGSHPSHAGYVSPTETLPLPKSQQPRSRTKRRRVRKRILTDTYEKQTFG